MSEKQTGTVTEADVRSVVASFVGAYAQTPPMYSAIKIGGKKLYELAREGKTVERKPRNVEIFSIVYSGNGSAACEDAGALFQRHVYPYALQ